MTDDQEQEQTTLTRYRRRIMDLKGLLAIRDATIAGKDAALRELGASREGEQGQAASGATSTCQDPWCPCQDGDACHYTTVVTPSGVVTSAMEEPPPLHERLRSRRPASGAPCALYQPKHQDDYGYGSCTRLDPQSETDKT